MVDEVAKTASFDVQYDRRVGNAVLNLFVPGGPLARLTKISRRAAFPLDLQMRRDPRTQTSSGRRYTSD